MKTIAWAVKTPKGKIRPEWIFDNEEEASAFADKLGEMYRPQEHFAVEVLITTSH